MYYLTMSQAAKVMPSSAAWKRDEPGGRTCPPVQRERRVFVVHGRNATARGAVFAFLRSIGLAPIEWHEALLATGKASPYVGEVVDAALADAQAVVILFTPDEVVALRPEYADGDEDPEVRPACQARPNVIFEAGLAIGRDPDRVVLVELGRLRQFSDVMGRHAVRLGNSLASRQEFAVRLRIAGCPVDLSGTDWHTSGDFSPPPQLKECVVNQALPTSLSPAGSTRRCDVGGHRAGERVAG
jgi:predicted nucleotide-binding protein